MLVANKSIRIGGKVYNAGERVAASELPPGKAEQLVAQRILRDTDASSPTSCLVLRDVRINGKNFKRGTKVNASRLDPGKVAQMLDHRIIGPVMTP